MNPRNVLAALLFLDAALCAAAEPPPEGLTCEQLYSIVKSAVQYRDEGYTLSQVLAALKSVQSEGKLSPSEIETVRKSITLVYMGNAWPEEVARECMEVKGKK